MALGSALATARNSLKVTSGQMGVVSQNIAGARDPDYTRRTSHTHMRVYGGVYATVRRESNPQLLESHLTKTSQATATGTIAFGMERLSGIYSGDDFSNSPARLLAGFRDALQLWANQYDQPGTGEAALARAKDLTRSLNHGTREIAKLQADADQDIKASVDNINSLLERFHEVDRQIGLANGSDRDSYSYMDERDAILKQLSEEIGVTSVTHADGTMSLYGMDGSTLYDKTPRKVTFETRLQPDGGSTAVVYVDKVPLDHSSFRDPNGGGNLGGLLKVRNDLAPQYQKQLDAMAGALVEMFPDLFRDGGDPSTAGLAGRIDVDPDFAPDREQLLEMVRMFDEGRSFDEGAGIAGSHTLIKFAENSISWVEAKRRDATRVAEYQNTMFMRSSEALSNATGVNTDDEMALMLQLEQSYSATARIISTVGKMMDDLMAAIR